MKKNLVPVQDHFPSLHSETIDSPVLSVLCSCCDASTAVIFLNSCQLCFRLKNCLYRSMFEAASEDKGEISQE